MTLTAFKSALKCCELPKGPYSSKVNLLKMRRLSQVDLCRCHIWLRLHFVRHPRITSERTMSLGKNYQSVWSNFLPIKWNNLPQLLCCAKGRSEVARNWKVKVLQITWDFCSVQLQNQNENFVRIGHFEFFYQQNIPIYKLNPNREVSHFISWSEKTADREGNWAISRLLFRKSVGLFLELQKYLLCSTLAAAIRAPFGW